MQPEQPTPLNQPLQPNRNRRIAIIAASAVFVLAIIAIAIATSSSLQSKPKASPTPTGNPTPTPLATPAPTPTPSDPAKAPAVINFLGTDSFLEYGITADQLDDIKFAFKKYVASAKLSTQTITVTNIVIAPHDPNSDTDTATFTAALDNLTLGGRFDYSNLTAGRLYLTNSAGTQIFDSGTIDLYNGVGD